jgi:hypothetical protein
MSEYIKLYLNVLDKEKLNFSEIILDRLKNGKSEHYNFNDISNNLLRDAHSEREKFTVRQIPYLELYRTFSERASKFEENHHLLVIPKMIESMFENINKDQELTFGMFIRSLAKYEASLMVLNLFRNNNVIFELMYRLGRFDGYKNMSKFEIVNYDRQTEGTGIFKELHAAVYPKKVKLKLKKEVLPKGEKNIPNYFGIRDKYFETFKSKILYIELTKGYINPYRTPHEAMVEGFFMSPALHNSKIYFECDTNVASYFFVKLNETIFKSLTQTKIDKSKVFLSNTSLHKPFSQTTISRTSKNIKETDKIEVDKLIEFIQNLK